MIRARRAYLGPDSVYYCENSAGHVYLTTPESPIPDGFVRKVAETAPDAERVWARIDQQERESIERMNEGLFRRTEAKYRRGREFLNSRLAASDCTQFERDFVRGALEVLDRKERALQQHSVYGVAAMQSTEAPLAPAAPKVTTDA